MKYRVNLNYDFESKVWVATFPSFPNVNYKDVVCGNALQHCFSSIHKEIERYKISLERIPEEDYVEGELFVDMENWADRIKTHNALYDAFNHKDLKLGEVVRILIDSDDVDFLSSIKDGLNRKYLMDNINWIVKRLWKEIQQRGVK